jgi:hypothetical protein
VWVAGAGVRYPRRKLKLAQKELALLCGVTKFAVCTWERTDGKIAMRQASNQDVLGLRGMGARQAKKALAEIGGRYEQLLDLRISAQHRPQNVSGDLRLLPDSGPTRQGDTAQHCR